jgi:hypothetical protein
MVNGRECNHLVLSHPRRGHRDLVLGRRRAIKRFGHRLVLRCQARRRMPMAHSHDGVEERSPSSRVRPPVLDARQIEFGPGDTVCSRRALKRSRPSCSDTDSCRYLAPSPERPHPQSLQATTQPITNPVRQDRPRARPDHRSHQAARPGRPSSPYRRQGQSAATASSSSGTGRGSCLPPERDHQQRPRARPRAPRLRRHKPIGATNRTRGIG